MYVSLIFFPCPADHVDAFIFFFELQCLNCFCRRLASRILANREVFWVAGSEISGRCLLWCASTIYRTSKEETYKYRSPR